MLDSHAVAGRRQPYVVCLSSRFPPCEPLQAYSCKKFRHHLRLGADFTGKSSMSWRYNTVIVRILGLGTLHVDDISIPEDRTRSQSKTVDYGDGAAVLGEIW